MTTTEAGVIRHPIWCKRVPDDAPLAGDPVGSPTFYDRLGEPEEDSEHAGHAFTLEVGETFAYSISAQSVLWHYEDQAPRIKLRIVGNESIMDAEAYLQVHEVGRLVELLQHVRQEVTPRG